MQRVNKSSSIKGEPAKALDGDLLWRKQEVHVQQLQTKHVKGKKTSG